MIEGKRGRCCEMKSRKFTWGLLILYWIFLTWIIVFKMELTFGGLPHRRSLNLIPLGASVIVNGELDFSEIIQNALAFIPFGVLMYALWEEKTVLKQMLPIVGTSLLFETMQFILAIGASDITDLISNSLGGLAGIGIAAALAGIFGKNWKRLINILCLAGALGMLLLIGLLFAANW